MTRNRFNNNVQAMGIVVLFIQCICLGSTAAFSAVSPQLKQAVENGLLVHFEPDLHILGTVHIGSRSAKEAQILIETVQPSNVVIEIPPSRLERIRSNIQTRKNQKIDCDSRNNITKFESNNRPQSSTIAGAINAYPSLAIAGWSKAGFSGFLFSTAIVWPSLLKRSITGNEEEETLPRRTEFEAAVEAADKIGANIIAVDLEFDELVQSFVDSMSVLSWVNLAGAIVVQSIGLVPVDPVKRRKGESLVDWERRRREVTTSRASRLHGEKLSPEVSRVLVDERDKTFAEACLRVMDENLGVKRKTVCIVGLVHVDGILKDLNS